MMAAFPRTLAVAALLCVLAPPALGCGYERWNVKVGADPDAGLISTGPHATTIAELDRLPAPPAPESRFNSRWRPVETTVYRVTGQVSAIRHERDGDLHLTLRDGLARLIVELPSPECAEKSRFLSKIIQARETADFLRRGEVVTVTGVGFFDVLHGQRGAAPNGIELHPVLAISGAPGAVSLPRNAPPPQSSASTLPSFATAARAHQHCPADTVVWLNLRSGIYHFAGERWYGRTRNGAYVCRREADRAGMRATRNRQ